MQSNSLKVLVIGSLEQPPAFKYPQKKYEAGFNLALELTNTYRLATAAETDSALTLLRRTGKAETALNVATVLNAEGVVFVQLRRLENVIRVEMQLATTPTFTTVRKGTGYGFIRYRTTKRDEPLLDPAVLSAMQRAFAATLGDTSLYSSQKGVLNVQPAPVLAIGGVSFTNDLSKPMWGLFANPTVKSYDAALIIAEQAAFAKTVFCFDIDTRDSIFALFRLYGIENDGQPSVNELDALYKFDVERYISGAFTRTENGAHITLTLSSLGSGAVLTPITTVETDLADDNAIAFRSALRKLTRQLLQID